MIFGRPTGRGGRSRTGQPTEGTGALGPSGVGQDSIGELDLLAYADGLLDRDPLRRADVERFLAAHPGQAARIRDFQAQNEALRRVGERWLTEPVPQRLLALLEAEPTRHRRHLLAAAAVAFLTAASAGGGWLAGTRGSSDPALLVPFAETALNDHRRLTGGEAVRQGPGSPAAAARGLVPLAWPAGSSALEIQAPDLAAYGYRLVGREHLQLDGTPAVRLGYRSSGGRSASLYLAPRPREAATSVRRLQAGGLTALHWLEGPLAVALTFEQAGGEESEALIGAVRRALAEPTLIELPAGSLLSQDASLPESRNSASGPGAAALSGSDPKL